MGSETLQQLTVEYAEPSGVRVCLGQPGPDVLTSAIPSSSDAVDVVSQCSDVPAVVAFCGGMPRPKHGLPLAPSGSEAAHVESQGPSATSAIEVWPRVYRDLGSAAGSLASLESHGSALLTAGWEAQGALRRAAEEASAASEVSWGGVVSDAN